MFKEEIKEYQATLSGGFHSLYGKTQCSDAEAAAHSTVYIMLYKLADVCWTNHQKPKSNL